MAESRRSIFEDTNENITVVLENEYFKVVSDPRSSKTYKIINGEVVPIALKELNMWKNQKKNPAGFNIQPLKNAEGKIVDYDISRVARGTVPTPAPAAPTAESPVRQAAPAAQAPARQAPPMAQAPARQAPPMAQAPARQVGSAAQAPARQVGSAAQAPARQAAPAAQAPARQVGPAAQAPARQVAPAAQAPARQVAPAAQAPARQVAPAAQASARQVAPAAQAPARQAAPMAQAPARQSAPMAQAPARQAPARGGAAGGMKTVVINDSERESRIKFEESTDVEKIFENDMFPVYRNGRTGRTFKVIGGEVANIEVRELNMWKNRIKNPGGFIVTQLNSSNGQIYDYKIERAAAPAAPVQDMHAQAADAPAPIIEKGSNGIPPIDIPPVNIPPANIPPLGMAPNIPESKPLSVQRSQASPAPAQASRPQAAPAPAQASRPQAAPAPAQASRPQAAPAPAQASRPQAAPAPAQASRPQAAAQHKHKPTAAVNEMRGTKPANRVKFTDNDTTEMVLETEFCKFYKDKRASKVFKVIDGEIVSIELRELNMWKNRIKNPSGFMVTKMIDSSGAPYDFIISKINEDGTVTAAPAVVAPAPVIIPDSQFAVADTPSRSPQSSTPSRSQTPSAAPSRSQTPSTAPSRSQTSSAVSSRVQTPVSAPVAPPVTKEPDKKRVKFEETPTMKMLLENEYFKIYTDSRRGATFKVINGEIAPLPQRELNMWKNRQRRPKDFAVKEIRLSDGSIYDYEIKRTADHTAAVETTTTKTNLPPVTERLSMGGSFKRPNSNRITNCAICNNRFKESELFLLDGKNICAPCMEVLVKEKLNVTEKDPVQKNIDDIISADEVYCTYSLVTNYPYLDDDFCVNICTIKRAAELGIEDTIAQTIDEKGAFFDDLKRFGLKKIIVNNDKSHVYAPEDFDDHIKTEGIIAPKLYFKVLNFMQKGDEELRSAIAESFLGSKVYTYALDQDITEITDENIDEFKPLTFTDGKNNFCPVFTDFTEARAVGMPFKGLYEIETRLLAYHKITHYIINPSSLGFIMNKTILKGAKPNYDKSIVDEDDERLKNIDEYINPFDLEDEVLAQIEEEKKAEEAKIILDIKEEAEKEVAEEKARADEAAKAAEKAIMEAEKAKEYAKKAQAEAEEAKRESEHSKIVAEESMKAANDANKARDEAVARAEKAEADAKAAAEAAKAEIENINRKKEQEQKEAEEKARAEAKAKAEEEAKAKIDAAPKLSNVPMGIPPAAAAAFKSTPGGFAPPAAAAAAGLKTPAAGGIFFSDEDKKSPLDGLNLGANSGPELPLLDLSGLADDPMMIEPEEAAPSSYFKPQSARSSDPLPPPMNEFKKTGIYGDKQIARGNGFNQTSIYESAQKKSFDYMPSSAAMPKSPVSKPPMQQPMPIQRNDRPMQRPGAEKIDNPDGLVIRSVSDGTDGSKVKKAFKVSKPLIEEDLPDDEIIATPYSDGVVSSAPVTYTNVSKTKGVNTVLSEIAQENERRNGMFDLSNLMYGDEPQSSKNRGKLSIQEQAAKTKATARSLEVESDPMTSKELREKLEQCYRDLAKLIAEADVMYAEFDAHTRHILIDGNNKGHIFSEKYLAEKSVENFARNNIKVYLQEYKGHDIFNMLFEYRRHGIQELVLDETAHWVILPTDRIAEMLDLYERDFVKIPVMNPELMFSMTTLFQKLQTKSSNPNKEQEVRSLEKRMIREFITARYVLPMYGNSRDDLRPVTIDNAAGMKKVLVFSDEFEMNRFFGENRSIVKDYEIVNYKEIIRKYTVPGESVVVLNEGSLRFEFNERNCEHITKVLEM